MPKGIRFQVVEQDSFTEYKEALSGLTDANS